MYYNISIIQSSHLNVFSKNHGECHHLGNETFKKNNWREHGPTHKGTMIFATTPSLTLPGEKSQVFPQGIATGKSSNMFLYFGTKDVYPKKTPPKTHMIMEKQPFGDVYPIKNGVSFRGCTYIYDKHLHVQPREKVMVKRFGEILKMKIPESPFVLPSDKYCRNQ